MKSKGRLHEHYTNNRLFNFKKGSICGCKDVYWRNFDDGTRILIRHSPCQYAGTPSATRQEFCAKEIEHFDRSGKQLNKCFEVGSPELFDQVLKNWGLIPQDLQVIHMG